jgi:hypothetical protein
MSLPFNQIVASILPCYALHDPAAIADPTLPILAWPGSSLHLRFLIVTRWYSGNIIP